MKSTVTLGPKGVRALAALCYHVTTNGSFAVDGRTLAWVLLEVAGAKGDAIGWGEPPGYSRAGRESLDRLRSALGELKEGD